MKKEHVYKGQLVSLNSSDDGAIFLVTGIGRFVAELKHYTQGNPCSPQYADTSLLRKPTKAQLQAPDNAETIKQAP